MVEVLKSSYTLAESFEFCKQLGNGRIADHTSEQELNVLLRRFVSVQIIVMLNLLLPYNFDIVCFFGYNFLNRLMKCNMIVCPLYCAPPQFYHCAPVSFL